MEDAPSGLALWIAGARVRTLPAAIIPVLVGSAAVADRSLDGLGGLTIWRALAAMVVALALQVGVNYSNDYSDGVRGTDDDRVGPLRLVGSGLVPAKQVKMAAFASFGVAALAGLGLAAVAGWWLILVGVAAVAAAWFYTGGSRPYGYAGFGELFVFVFFGVVATVGSAYVQTEEFDGLSWLASVAVGLLAVALLVTNNLRDIPGDTQANKMTLAVRLGDPATRMLYHATVVIPFVLIVAIALLWDRPWALLGLIGMVPAAKALQQVAAGAKGRELIAVLQRTAGTQLVAGVLFAVGLYLSA